MSRADIALLGACLLSSGQLLSCEKLPARSPVVAQSGVACHYEAVLLPTFEMQVWVSCQQPIGSLRVERPSIVDHLTVSSWNGSRLSSDSARLSFETDETELHYSVDLLALAQRHDDPDVAQQFGTGLLTAASSWLLAPQRPGKSSITVRLTSKMLVAAAMGPVGEVWRLDVATLPIASYVGFGAFTEAQIKLVGAASNGAPQLRVITLPGPFETSAAERIGWLTEAAQAVGEFWGGFPTSTTLFLTPRPGYRGVVRGKVVAAGGPSVLLELGSETPAETLREDWVVVHELFHLGVPSLGADGKWLDEGLATYFEPIIRVRAGWYSEQQLWSEFADNLPRGKRALAGQGLPELQSELYWAGALLSLLADVDIRKKNPAAGLESALRVALDAEGHAGHFWPLKRLIESVDASSAIPALQRQQSRHSLPREVQLADLLSDLGVVVGEAGVVLHDDAPLAGLRRSIVSGAASSFTQ